MKPETWLTTSAWGGGRRFAEGDGEDPIVVRRRRPAGPGGGGPRERADAPERRREEPSPPPAQPESTGGSLFGGGGSTGSGGGGSSSGQRSGGSMALIVVLAIAALVVICICLAISSILPSSSTQGPAAAEPTVTRFVDTGPTLPALIPPATPTRAAAVAPTSAPASAITPAAGGQKWTVMLYQDADDRILEEDIYVDLNEAERTGSTSQVAVVAQMDRYQAGYSGDGNWTTAKRFYVSKDNDLDRVASRQVADLGEVDMADYRTLVDFAVWAIKSYPADKYALILSDHGMGWPGGFSDGDNKARGDANLPLAQAAGKNIYLMQLDTALAQIRQQTGVDKFEFLGLDACLMSHIEVASVLAAHGRYAVASQETEPALGWAYTSFLANLTQNPNLSGGDLGKAVVQSYIQQDQRILDDQARANLLRQNSGMGGLFGTAPRVSAQQLAQQMSESVTLSALDLSRVPTLMASLNDFAVALQGVSQERVARARTSAQSYTSIWGQQVPPSYLDLGSFTQFAKQFSSNQQVSQAADRLLADLGQAVIAEKHGPNKPGSTGLSIYFPNSQLYGSDVAGAASYTQIARRFAGESAWDDFLAFHYTGRRFSAPPSQAQAAATLPAGIVPQRASDIRAPGAGAVTVSPVRLSGTSVAPGGTIRMTADIQGQNVGYIYLFAGYLDQANRSIFLADMDYLDSSDTRQIGGVFYPTWSSSGRFTIQFDWEPIVFAISDGRTRAVTMLRPERYGASPDEAVYTVDGVYTYARDGQRRRARLYFSNGTLRHVYGFTEGDTGAPREIVPERGDKFTLQEQWLDIGAAGQPATAATQDGDTLTFNNEAFTWQLLDAAAGQYVIGFIVQDLDGNSYESHGNVTVR